MRQLSRANTLRKEPGVSVLLKEEDKEIWRYIKGQRHKIEHPRLPKMACDSGSDFSNCSNCCSIVFLDIKLCQLRYKISNYVNQECKQIKPVSPKENQSWIFIGRTDAEAEAPILWPPDAKSWLFRKDPDAGKGWRQEEKGTTEDEIVGWHHWLNGHEFEQALSDGEGQGSLTCCSPWGRKELEVTEQLNKNKECFGALVTIF